jgi:hypothetical protein
MKEDKLAIIAYNDVEWLHEGRTAPIEISIEHIRNKFNNNIDINKIKVLDSEGKLVKFQIDRIDPQDSTKDVLIFEALVKDAPSAYYISVDQSDISHISKPINDKNNWDFVLESQRIELIFKRDKGYKRSAGSFSNLKIKDPKNSEVEYARASDSSILAQPLVINTIHPEQDWVLADGSYDYVGEGKGDLRTFLTFKMPMFIEFKKGFRLGSGNVFNKCNCELYRIISIYSDKDYFLDEIFIEAKSLENKDGIKTNLKSSDGLHFQFNATFYSYIPDINKYNDAKIYYPSTDIQNRGWFAVGSLREPYLGFGFACNSALNGDVNMLGDYFIWKVAPTYHLKCLHQFMDKTNTQVDNMYRFDHVVGANWFNAIFKPLWAI